MQRFFQNIPSGAGMEAPPLFDRLVISINGLDYQICLLHLTHDSNPNFLGYPDVSRPYIAAFTNAQGWNKIPPESYVLDIECIGQIPRGTCGETVKRWNFKCLGYISPYEILPIFCERLWINQFDRDPYFSTIGVQWKVTQGTYLARFRWERCHP